MPSRYAANTRSLVTMRELADAIEDERTAGRFIVEKILLRRLQFELYRYNWNYRLDDLPQLARYLDLCAEEEPEPFELENADLEPSEF